MTEYDYDVLYLGCGHGTFDGAIPLSQSGKKVAVIESGLIGGTCPNRGCNAKITLDTPVKLVRSKERLNGIVKGNWSLDWSQMVAQKQAVIDPLPDMIAGLLQGSGVTIIHGQGTLTDAHTINVGGQSVTADKIVIATGLRPHKLSVPGTELTHDSEDFMNLKALPKRLTIVGAGYIAMEFATIANAAGADVTVLMHGDQALRQFHQPFVNAVIDDLTKRGVSFVKKAQVSAFAKNGNALTVSFGDGQSLTTDWILDATGRIPNVENIGLEKVGVKYSAHGIEVNDHLQTSVANIYASGDVIDKKQPKLTPTAIFESVYLMQLFSGQTNGPIDYPAIPSTVFTSPRIAKVGESVESAQTTGDSVVVNHIADDWYRQIDKQTLGDSKLVFNSQHQLVGATEMSEEADNAIDTLLPAIEFGLDASQIGRIVNLFPSIASSAWEKL
ncbi:dihydrolipoyl dehydrogenase family protein [Secundilactobacillus folii]|uniref:NAD(P)/FAD-dependent oxidoreductase n=1 Tax=Secundilactobacillus folii TaxID=2678357 RepID=A0A7X2XTJ3_9LACO|nr:NAD(P)/FAD-dependent oxidoreductase [Secundilactobacillus folii]MTV81341.1 NAD(P)/FAD-dependent oxidoreductase [Secundilactobacillus folii]